MTRPRWRKKPVVIDAVRISEVLRDAAHNWNNLPSWVREGYEQAQLIFARDSIHIKTTEGTMIGGYTDWLLRGVQGELYPCKAEIFLATYEPVTEDQ